MAICNTCSGTGSVFCLRSMFLADGYRRERCGICSGSGQSSYRDSAGYIRFQREARIMDSAHRAAPKGLSDAALAERMRQALVSA